PDPKYELNKDEPIQLSEKVQTLLSNTRFSRLCCQTNPYATLLYDSEHVKEDILNEQVPTKNVYETQLLTKELENEKTFQNQLLIVLQEKFQLQNEAIISKQKRIYLFKIKFLVVYRDNIKFNNQELEQQLNQVISLLDYEHDRHKKFVILLFNEHVSSLDEKVIGTVCKPQSKSRHLQLIGSQASLPTNNSSPSSSNFDKSSMPTTDTISRITIIPILSSSKNDNNSITKTAVVSPSIPTRTQQTLSFPVLLSLLIPTVAKSNVRPIRSILNLHSSPKKLHIELLNRQQQQQQQFAQQNDLISSVIQILFAENGII
ncbi:unnamed protein product, partial [Rotaria sp. Silwood1]